MSIGVFAKVGKRKAAEARKVAQPADAEEWERAANESTDDSAAAAGAARGPGAENGWPALRFDQYLAHPPAAVWRALTDPELVARWWGRVRRR